MLQSLNLNVMLPLKAMKTYFAEKSYSHKKLYTEVDFNILMVESYNGNMYVFSMESLTLKRNLVVNYSFS